MAKFQEMMERAGFETRSYSGRSMYGKHCLGVEFNGSVGEMFAEFLCALEGEDDQTEALEQAVDAFRKMRTDNLGHDGIAYFPGVPYEREASDDEDDGEMPDGLGDEA